MWGDLSKEQLFSHNQVKQEFNRVLGNLVKEQKLGGYFPDGMLLTNKTANLTCQPDGAFVSSKSFQSGRVSLVEGVRDGFVELEGSPDMVLEVVRDSSVEKDTDTLMDLYFRANVQEYWLVDARGDELQFAIYVRGDNEFVQSPVDQQWVTSSVLANSYRLQRETDALGHPEFMLSIR